MARPAGDGCRDLDRPRAIAALGLRAHASYPPGMHGQATRLARADTAAPHV
jgi:hypothetical protein